MKHPLEMNSKRLPILERGDGVLSANGTGAFLFDGLSLSANNKRNVVKLEGLHAENQHFRPSRNNLYHSKQQKEQRHTQEQGHVQQTQRSKQKHFRTQQYRPTEVKTKLRSSIRPPSQQLSPTTKFDNNKDDEMEKKLMQHQYQHVKHNKATIRTPSPPKSEITQGADIGRGGRSDKRRSFRRHRRAHSSSTPKTKQEQKVEADTTKNVRSGHGRSLSTGSKLSPAPPTRPLKQILKKRPYGGSPLVSFSKRGLREQHKDSHSNGTQNDSSSQISRQDRRDKEKHSRHLNKDILHSQSPRAKAKENEKFTFTKDGSSDLPIYQFALWNKKSKNQGNFVPKIPTVSKDMGCDFEVASSMNDDISESLSVSSILSSSHPSISLADFDNIPYDVSHGNEELDSSKYDKYEAAKLIIDTTLLNVSQSFDDGDKHLRALSHFVSEELENKSQCNKSNQNAEKGNVLFRTTISPSLLAWKRGELIGKGTYGSVHMGLNKITGELFAVKEIRILDGGTMENADKKVKELAREIKLMRELQHPHIVRYLGAEIARDDEGYEEEYEGDEGDTETNRQNFPLFCGKLYIFIEYIPGGSISRMLQQFGPFGEALVIRLSYQILLGVDYLHQKGILHRDIKGANVLITKSGTAKLADFGCSKQLQDVNSVSLDKSLETLRGSIPWMAPEVIRQSSHGKKADIWSVGATVIEMLTASHPWRELPKGLTGLFSIATAKQAPTLPKRLPADNQRPSEQLCDFLYNIDGCLCLNPDERGTAKDLIMHKFFDEERIKYKSYQ